MDERMNAAEVIAAHLWRGDTLGCECGWNWPEERTWFCGEDERIAKAHVAHQLDALREAGWVLIHPESTTRVDIIGPGVKEFWADEWAASIQDEGRTLKLFQFGDGHEARADRNKRLVDEINANIAAAVSQDGEK